MNNSRWKVTKQVPRVLFGGGAINGLKEELAIHRSNGHGVFVLDAVLKNKGLEDILSISSNDEIIYLGNSYEPLVEEVDCTRDRLIKNEHQRIPKFIVAVGGGSTLDFGKALSVMLTNPGSAALYQGWDLVSNPAVFKIGVPTLSGTGAEASRTAVLTGPDKKYGINSDQSMFDTVILDPNLLKWAPPEQRFYTGMDCYIHSMEALEGSFINSLGRAYAGEALRLCRQVFLSEEGSEEDLMVASFFGGVSVANSEVGVVHALSYGLSLVLGYRHGIANCIVLRALAEFYPKYVIEFEQMLEKHNIDLPIGVARNLDSNSMNKMVAMTRKMSRPLESALGSSWADILTEDKIKSLYENM